MTLPTIPAWSTTGTNLSLAWQGLRTWNTRHVTVATTAAVAVALVVGFATVLIPNSLFSRQIAPEWWNYPVWLVTSALSGMLAATYLRSGDAVDSRDAATRADAAVGLDTAVERRTSRLGLAGGVLAWFAVGCPVCNKLALLALGYSGAITWFAPLQPLLAGGALTLTGLALVWRLRGQVACPTPRRTVAASR